MEEWCDPKNSVNGDAFALVRGGLAGYYQRIVSGGHAVIVGLGRRWVWTNGFNIAARAT